MPGRSRRWPDATVNPVLALIEHCLQHTGCPSHAVRFSRGQPDPNELDAILEGSRRPERAVESGLETHHEPRTDRGDLSADEPAGGHPLLRQGPPGHHCILRPDAGRARRRSRSATASPTRGNASSIVTASCARSSCPTGLASRSKSCCARSRCRYVVEDWRALPHDDQAHASKRFDSRPRGQLRARSCATRPNDAHSRNGRTSLCVFTFHHLVLDGWSCGVLLDEFLTVYAALMRSERVTLPDVRPFRDYIAWLREQDMSAAEAYWRDDLAGYAHSRGGTERSKLLQSRR